ncbi:hypothetical protein ACFLZ0_01130 [Patescibacteria group bacterium]
MNKKYLIILAIIILAGLLLRIYPFNARSWVMDYDTEVVRQALDLGSNIIDNNFSFLTKPVLYPYLTSYCLFFVYGIFYLMGRFMGLFSSANSFISYIFFHLNEFYWYSRLLTSILGSLIIPLSYFIVIKLFREDKQKKIAIGSLLASFLCAFSILCIQFSQQIRPHIVVSFFFLLSFYLFLNCLERRTLWSFICLGISAGLTAGSLQTGFLSFIFVILAVYFVNKGNFINWHFSDLLKIFFSKQFLVGFLSFLVIILILYPYVFLNLNSTFIAGNKIDFTLSGGRHFNNDGHTKTFPLLNQNTIGMAIFKGFLFNELSLFLLLIIFLVIYFSQRKEKRILINSSKYFKNALFGLLVFICLYSIFLVVCGSIPRYRLLCPLIPFVCIFVGILFISILNNDLIKYRKLLYSFIVFLLLFELIQAFRLVQLMQKPYTRDDAVEWIKENINSSDLIIFQKVFPNLVLSKESIEVQTFLQDGVLSRQNIFLLSLDNEGYFKNSKTIIDFRSVLEYKKQDVLEIYKFIKKIKPSYLVLSSRSMAIAKEGYCLEFQIANKYGQLVESFSPFKDNQSEKSLVFPSGLDNPLIDLWVSKRLGPIVEIYKLNWNND